jgi:hypothetical protein
MEAKYKNNCIESILNKNRIHCLKYKEYNKTLIEIKDTLLQKLNIYSKRLKRYKNNKQRKFENKLFRNNEKFFYKYITDNKIQANYHFCAGKMGGALEFPSDLFLVIR